jgi:hypothetical protein
MRTIAVRTVASGSTETTGQLMMSEAFMDSSCLEARLVVVVR